MRRATVAASGSVPPVSAFDSVMMSGVDARCLAGEHAAGAAEAGEDFVEDQQQIVAVRRGRAGAAARLASWNSMPPAPCTSGSTMMPASSSACRSSTPDKRCDAFLVARQLDHDVLGQKPAKQRVHAVVWIAHRHRAGGVAVIAAAEGDELAAPAHARG